MLNYIDVISPESKDYVAGENNELQAIVTKLKEGGIISSSQYNRNLQEIQQGRQLSPAFLLDTQGQQSNVLDYLSKVIGNTPSNTRDIGNGNILVAKDESANPFGSHYDRVLSGMLPKVIQKNPLQHVVEVSSGSLGVSLAGIASYIMGQKTSIITAENDFPIRYSIAQRLGANIHLTEKDTGISGAGNFYTDNVRNFLREKLLPLNHSHKHWGSISPKVQQIGIEIETKIDYYMAIKGNGTAALGIAEGLKIDNPNLQVYGLRYEGKKGGALNLPGNDHTDICFPRIEEFEQTHQTGEILLSLNDIRKRSEEKSLGMSSAAGEIAVEKFIQDGNIQEKTFCIITHDACGRY